MKIKALDVLLNGRHIGVLREEPTGRHTFTYDLGGSDTTTLINRMGTSIVEQGARVLGWFAD